MEADHFHPFLTLNVAFNGLRPLQYNRTQGSQSANNKSCPRKGLHSPDLLELCAVDLDVEELLADSADHLLTVTRRYADVVPVGRFPLGDQSLRLAADQANRRRGDLRTTTTG